MADCCNHFSFSDDGDSYESWQGLRGPYFTPHLSADGVLSWTNTGNLLNPAPVDISGPPGPPMELRGPVASVADLPATAPSGELWLVGAASPYDGYFFNGGSWKNLGQIAVGPAGPQGERGPQGPVGPQGPAVPLSGATPLMDGPASAGTGTSAAREDHRHPPDTSRVAKTGDTMTGGLTVKEVLSAFSGTMVEGTAPSASTWSPWIRLQDKNAITIGFFTSTWNAAGDQGLKITARRVINNSNVDNGFELRTSGSGVKAVILDEPSAWRTALGLVATEESATVSPNAQKTYALSNSEHGIIVTSGSQSTTRCLIIYNVTSGGAVSHTMLGDASAVSVTDGTNSITISNTAAVLFSAFKMTW